MELGYARVSTGKQDLERQLDALAALGIADAQVYVDKKSGSTTDRPGLQQLLAHARQGDVIVVHTLDRLGRTVRDSLNLIHDLNERGVGLRNLADPIRIDTTDPHDPMAQLAVIVLALFAQMERTYALERAAHARAVATAKGRRVGRPATIDASKIEWAAHLRDHVGLTVAEIIAKTGIPRTSLYRHLPQAFEIEPPLEKESRALTDAFGSPQAHAIWRVRDNRRVGGPTATINDPATRWLIDGGFARVNEAGGVTLAPWLRAATNLDAERHGPRFDPAYRADVADNASASRAGRYARLQLRVA